MQPTLYSERLILRPYQVEDGPAVQRLAGDIRIADTTTTIPHPYPPDAAEAWISTHAQAFSERTGATFAITLRDTGVLVGTISLIEISMKHARAEVGYWIGVEFWGYGYCTEALNKIISFALESLSVTRIVARCLARNPASARVMEKSGLKREGLLSKHILKNGTYEDILLYGLVLPARGGA
jgi:ribosomal-protein-alanine N-acetyltransferase